MKLNGVDQNSKTNRTYDMNVIEPVPTPRAEFVATRYSRIPLLHGQIF